jgi:heavy metal translocating P-type ATPase
MSPESAPESPPVPASSDEDVQRFRISGMDCASCAASVSRAIERLPGVRTAAVDLGTAEAVVRGAGLDPAAIGAAVGGAGFGAEPLAEARTPTERRTEIERSQLERERSWARRAASGILIWLPMVALHWLAPEAWSPVTPWLLAALATLSVVVVGSGFYRSAGRALRRGRTNMDTLISLGATTAWISSLVKLIGHAAGWLPAPEALWFGETAGLFALVSVGHWLEARAGARAGAAVRELLELQPDEASRLEPGGEERRVGLREIQPGDRIRIRPGERIPVDGVVVGGATEVDVSAVTGEPMPVTVGPGDEVAAGCLNGTGTMIVRATADGAHSTVARIADMVAAAQTSKADIQRLADRISAIFVPLVIGIAVATLLGWWLGAGDLATGLISAVTVLVISCPCALGIATPIAVTVAAGTSSRHGILLRSAAAIERAGHARTVIFDKTGTLTTGRLTVSRIEPEPGTEARTVLMAAAAVEAMSEHPIARAITAAAADAGVALRPVGEFRAMPGEGATGVVDGIPVTVRRDPESRAACVVEARGRIIGRVHVTDPSRPETPAVIAALRELNLSILMLTGDRQESAEAVGRQLGLTNAEIAAGVDPAGKQRRVAESGPGSIMVGDGINDAAALAEADLGIAIGSGTNVAMESADVVLTADSIRGVPAVIAIARATLRTIRQNLFFAFFYNTAAIPAAAFGLLGPHGPLVAALAMAASDLCVVGNAIRLRPAIERIVRKTLDSAPAAPEDGPVDGSCSLEPDETSENSGAAAPDAAGPEAADASGVASPRA